MKFLKRILNWFLSLFKKKKRGNVKPTGTASIVSMTSQGIYPVNTGRYFRQVKLSEADAVNLKQFAHELQDPKKYAKHLESYRTEVHEIDYSVASKKPDCICGYKHA